MLIFIISFPRTGGMALCETIGKHPDIKVLNEVVDWKEKIPPGWNYVIKIFWYDIYNTTLKTNIFKDRPGAKFIFLTRNPLDIAASYKRLFGKLKERGLTIMPYLISPPLKEEAAWISAVKQYQDKLRWVLENKENPDLLIISFEEMILKKHETFKKVFEHIGFSYDDKVKEVVEKEILNEVVPGRIGKAATTTKEKRIGSYDDILTRWEIKKIDAIFPRSARAF